ncbi:MAG: hypothetical protein IT384_27770 [Deltaproteobacteria bacterium]|nr:hypothetical protein [Deltaproteobacteria bacterium]
MGACAHRLAAAGAAVLPARLALLVLLALLAHACGPAAPVVLLPAEYDLIVVWTRGEGGGGELHVRPSGASLDVSVEGGVRLFAYRSTDLGVGGAGMERLEGTRVRALDDCGPALPPADRAFAISADGEVTDISGEPVPSMEAVALPCHDLGEPVYATPLVFTAACATSSASQRGRCTLCFDLVACSLSGAGEGACDAPLLSIRTKLDGTLCGAPPPGTAPCSAGPSRRGSDAVLDCTRSTEGELTIDIVRRRGPPPLEVTRFELSGEPDYDLVRNDDAPALIVTGLLSDLVALPDQLVVIRRAVDDNSGHACPPSAFGTLLFVSRDGQLLRTQAPARPCLLRLAADPLDPSGFLGGHLVADERIARVVRYNELGVERERVGELPLPPVSPGSAFADIFRALTVTGTSGAERVSALAVSEDNERRTTWATWSFASGAWDLRAEGVIEGAAYLFAQPIASGSGAGSLAVSDDESEAIAVLDPLDRAPAMHLFREAIHGEVAQGPVITLSTGDRWLVVNGGLAAGTITLFTRQGQRTFVPYFAGNQAALTDLIEIAPDVVLVAALRLGSGPALGELAIARADGDRLWFEPQLLPLGPGIVGRFARGELCPDGVRTRVVWALAPWTGDLLRIALPCD